MAVLCSYYELSSTVMRLRWILRSRGNVDAWHEADQEWKHQKRAAARDAYRVANQQRMFARRAFEWMGKLKAQLVLSMKYQTCFFWGSPVHSYLKFPLVALNSAMVIWSHLPQLHHRSSAWRPDALHWCMTWGCAHAVFCMLVSSCEQLHSLVLAVHYRFLEAAIEKSQR